MKIEFDRKNWRIIIWPKGKNMSKKEEKIDTTRKEEELLIEDA